MSAAWLVVGYGQACFLVAWFAARRAYKAKAR